MLDRSYSSVKTCCRKALVRFNNRCAGATGAPRDSGGACHCTSMHERRSTAQRQPPLLFSWAPLHIDLNGMWRKVNPALPNGPLRTTSCPRSCSCVLYWHPVCNSLAKALLPASQCRGLQGSTGQEVVIVNVLSLIYFWVLVDLLKCTNGSVHG